MVCRVVWEAELMETLTRLPQCPSPPLEALSLQYSRAGVSTSLRVPLAQAQPAGC